jgi:hypothetical protein
MQESNLVAHNIRKHNQKLTFHPCSYCEITFITENQRDAHVAEVNSNTYM